MDRWEGNVLKRGALVVGLSAAAFAVASIVAPAAQATTGAGVTASAESYWEFERFYPMDQEAGCEIDGQAGLAAGEWRDYQCVYGTVGAAWLYVHR